MLVIWAIGLFVLHIGMLIHFFLLLAVLAMIIKVVRDNYDLEPLNIQL